MSEQGASDNAHINGQAYELHASYRPDQEGRLRYILPDMTLERSCVLFIFIVAVIQCTFQHKQQYIVG